MSANDNPLQQPSTNWTESAKAVLSPKYPTEGLSFEQLTNLLSKESDEGNVAARGLWGFALEIRGKQPQAGVDLVRSAAEQGYVPAMLNLGYLYTGGGYLEKDYEKAFHWFALAADKGDAEGETQLGGCYHLGLGTNQDYSMAAKWYRRAAEQTNYVAMKSLGYLLMNGMGVEKDLKEAKYWSARAANEGHNPRAMLNMGGLAILESSPTNVDAMAEAFRWYKQSADLGDALASLQVAYYYYNGWGVLETNMDDYHRWLLKAANLGSTEAQYFLAQDYRTGNDLTKDPDEALRWYKKAAAKNDPRALYDLAVLYSEQRTNLAQLEMSSKYMLEAARRGHRAAQLQYALSCFRGDVAAQDCDSGKQWLAKAAENNWGRAEFLLFQLCYAGAPPAAGCTPYSKDPVEGVKWLRRAAADEDFQAQSTLAVMLIQGKGVEQDKKEAERLLRNAATHGYARGECDLGFAIMDGDASETNLVESATWSKLAVTTGTDPSTVGNSKVNLDKALGRLTWNERMEVDRRVSSFRPVPVAVVDPMVKGWETNADYQREDGRLGH